MNMPGFTAATSLYRTRTGIDLKIRWDPKKVPDKNQIIPQRTVCHELDMIDWWVITGMISEYGGVYCHRH
jgi:hypothetical protein